MKFLIYTVIIVAVAWYFRVEISDFLFKNLR
jgi:hypothetical protein